MSRRVLLHSLVVFAAAFLAGNRIRGVQAPDRSGQSFHLFLLAGQSNMAGRGEVEPEDRVTHPRVWMFSKTEQWLPAIDPMHFDKPIAGVGPGRSFGIAVADADPGIHVGLVPAAVGGSSVTAWVPGAIHAETGARPYDEALSRARAAMSAGTFRAVLWHQGESDATTEGAPQYEARLRSVIARLRSELKNPSLPVLIGQLGRFAGNPWPASREQVDAVHRRLAVELTNVAFVSSEGLTDKGDGVHFNSAAARTLGRRYAEAYRNLTRK